jgi:hypothetical protein
LAARLGILLAMAAWAACVHAPFPAPANAGGGGPLAAADAGAEPSDPRTESGWAWKQFCEGVRVAGTVEVTRANRRFSCTDGTGEVSWADAGPTPSPEELRRFVDSMVRCLENDEGVAFTWEFLGERYACPSGRVTSAGAGSLTAFIDEVLRCMQGHHFRAFTWSFRGDRYTCPADSDEPVCEAGDGGRCIGLWLLSEDPGGMLFGKFRGAGDWPPFGPPWDEGAPTLEFDGRGRFQR